MEWENETIETLEDYQKKAGETFWHQSIGMLPKNLVKMLRQRIFLKFLNPSVRLHCD